MDFTDKATALKLLRGSYKGYKEGAKLVGKGTKLMKGYLPEDLEKLVDEARVLVTDEDEDPKKRKNGESTPLIGQEIENGFYSVYVRPCVAEFFATAVFVFAGTMSAQSLSTFPIAVTHGISAIVLIASFSHLSGGHFNPAITLGVALCDGIKPVLAVAYIVVQIIGAILGAAFCRGVLSYYSLPNATTTLYAQLNGGAHKLADGVTPGMGILNEAVITSLLITAVLMTAVDSRGNEPMGAAAIGLAIMTGIMAGGTQTGGSMNPARSFGPAVVMSNINKDVWNYHYVYWVGPFIGTIVAVLFYRFVYATYDRRLILKDNNIESSK